MLHAAIGVFLDTLTEREFDPTILALLADQGFHDVHFIHGAFEFGKDIVAKRTDADTGEVRQYAIQSKAGDIGQSEWRAVRPQLEESEYNTRAHPNYDETLDRVAVLMTTGRLKGSAAIDAQEFKASVEARGVATVELWDKQTLSAWLVTNPELAIVSLTEQEELQRMLTDVRSNSMDEPTLERFSRRWMAPDLGGVAAVEAAILISALRDRGRLDLAAMCAIDLFRAARLRDNAKNRSAQAESAHRLFLDVSARLLDAVEPLLDDPADLAREGVQPAALVSYAVTAVRIAEILALASLTARSNGDKVRFACAVLTLVRTHPGVTRPVSDQFAVSLLPIAVVVHRDSTDDARTFVRAVATWLIDRSDPSKHGLGLGSMDESPRAVIDRLLGGALESNTVTRTYSSYVLTVVLDLCLALGDTSLYDDVCADAGTLRITPRATSVRGKPEMFHRGGGAVMPVPRLAYDTGGAVTPKLAADAGLPAPDTMLLVAACRSRHYTAAVTNLLTTR